MAAVGALLVSSGIALMAAPTPAGATPGGGDNLKDYVCKYVGTPGTGERLKEGNDGLVWVDSHASQGTWFNDAHGSSYVLRTNVPKEPAPARADCPTGRVEIAVDIHFVDPNCDNENTPSYFLTGDTDHVTVATSRDPAAGQWITVTATAKSGYVFDHFAPAYSEMHKYGKAASCMSYDATASIEWQQPTCLNGNQADYATNGNHVSFAITDGSVAPGHMVEITATADAGHMFQGDPPTRTKVFTFEFDAAKTGCNITPLSPSFVDPTCTTAPSVKLPQAPAVTPQALRSAVTVPVGPVAYEVTGDMVAGGTVVVTATLVDTNEENSTFAPGAVTKWTHTFTTPTGCTTVSPPAVAPTTEVSPPKTHVKHKTEVKAETTTPTVVEAGLAGTTTDTSLQTGLGLALAGLALMAGAAGLVLVGGGKDEDTA
jgi:hypothetical protein